MLIGGVTPILSAEELGGMGFKIVVAPIETLAVTGFAVRKLAQAMRDRGRVDHLSEEMLSFAEMKKLLGLADWLLARVGVDRS
jgi:2-methylisocitrate lyase-like PEP mutase family enzyme